MFTRRDSQTNKTQTESRSPSEAPVVSTPEPSVAVPQAVVEAPQPVPPLSPQTATAGQQNMSLIATGDVFEGKLTTTNGVRVQGTVRGTIESKSNIQVEADALVEADLSAENVTIAGTYKGNLNCNGRLEITASGRASGELETGRILLHEGGFFEGSLHMRPENSAPAHVTTSADGGRRRYTSESRS